MHRIPPTFHSPTHLPPRLPLLQIRKLPQMMHGVQIAHLHEPGSHPFHHFFSCVQASPPVGFPFEEVAWVEGVGAEFEEAAELARRGGGPEGEFLHEGGLFVGYELLELGIEGGEVGVVSNGVEGGVVAVVALVFPYMDFNPSCQRAVSCDVMLLLPKVSQSPTSVRQLPTRCT